MWAKYGQYLFHACMNYEKSLQGSNKLRSIFCAEELASVQIRQ